MTAGSDLTADQQRAIAMMHTPQPDGRARRMWQRGDDEPVGYDGQLFCRHGSNAFVTKDRARWMSTCTHFPKSGPWDALLQACGPVAECQDQDAADARPVESRPGDEALATQDLNRALRDAENLVSHIGKWGYDGSPVMALVRHVRASQ